MEWGIREEPCLRRHGRHCHNLFPNFFHLRRQPFLRAVDVLVLGFANLVADGISMGFGDFVSTTTENDVAARERSITQWDVENQRRNQQQLLAQKYRNLGMSAADADLVVSIFAKYPETLVDEKMVAEKGMVSPDRTNNKKPWKNGLVTFASFLVFGCAPLLAFIVLIPFTKSVKIKFMAACFMSALALAILGLAKAKIAGQRCLLSMATTLGNGAVAGAAAYAIGWTLRNVAGLQE
ncbi:uncharacterized protein LOC127246678 isoform X2 [Andrographis paniculata]|uniref:uncharacterized protein LOC127246678 isoform X2 n=1 Tax=Andrographis paniculata TaxID=175694 RepID=UPI0021E8877A|nr:uncharacterized protein LOC127246678 isoform X2 [Andrographis paniculata]